MKYGEFAEFEKLVEKIRRDVEAKCRFPVYKDSHLPKSLRFSLYKSKDRPKYVFAQIWSRNRAIISSAKKWAIRAKVARTISHERTNGWYGRDDAVYWYVKTMDCERYEEIIGALARICQMR